MAGVRLRGRSGELEQLLAPLRRAVRTGQGAVVAVVGEPGIGKSALLAEAGEQARRLGFAVGAGKAEEIDRIAPGAPLLVALRSGTEPLLDAASFASLAPLAEKQVWLVDRISDLLEERAARTPLLLVVDDVQWIDPLTRFALRVLTARLAGSPVVWLLGSRPGAALPDLADVTTVTPAPLTAADLADLARDHLGATPDDDATRLLTRAGGNPFWAVQVLDGLRRRRAAGLPEDDLAGDIVDDLRRRTRDLPDDVRDLVRLVAVRGRSTPVAEAAELLGVAPAAVVASAARAADAGLLTRDGSGLRFRHDLVREALYADLPSAVRRELHRRWADHLLARGALAAATHVYAAAEPGDVVAAGRLLDAAVESLAVAPDQAAMLAREAVRLHPDVRRRALDVLVAAQHHGEVVALADALGGPEAQVLAARARYETGAAREAEQRADAALATGGLPPAIAARLHAVRALAATRTDQAPTAAARAEAALAEATRLGDGPARETALIALVDAARNAGTHQTVLDRFGELRRVSSKAHLAEQIRALQHLDRYEEAEAVLASVGDAGVLPSFLYARIWQDHNLGRLEAADAGARTLLRAAEETENLEYQVNARMIAFAVAVYRGDVAAARAALEVVESALPDDDELRLVRLRLVQGWLVAAEGDPVTASRMLAPLVATADDGRQAWAWSPPWMYTLASIARAAGDLGMLAGAARVALLGAERNPGVVSMAGVGLLVSGMVGPDVGRLAEAVEVLRSSPRPMLLAAALYEHGQASSSVDALRESHELYRAVGAHAYAKEAAELLTALGARPRRAPTPRPTHGWDALTDTERLVARLIVEGHTNRTAAAELNVSTNTVGTHLRAVFAKLGVHSRVQLANAYRDAATTGTAAGA